MTKSFYTASTVSMGSTVLSNGYEVRPRNRGRTAQSTCRAVILRSIPFLVEARLHLVRWTDWPDRHHADRVGREEEMDQSVTIFTRVELLHVASRSGSDPARDSHRVAST